MTSDAIKFRQIALGTTWYIAALAMNYPQKRNYRQRAHSNPIADHKLEYPGSPEEVDWSTLFPHFRSHTDQVSILDIGCGYGGLCVTLSEMYPHKFIVGMEIRVKVSEFTKERISALRTQSANSYTNVCCIRANAMKNLPNYFSKNQIEKMFFLYPDPHFKANKHKWRIINSNLLSEYAYILAKNAIVYTLTDVFELHDWIVTHFVNHPMFRRIEDANILDNDPIVRRILIDDCSEEGKKVSRNNGEKFLAVFVRI